jgi:hypothetical protein
MMTSMCSLQAPALTIWLVQRGAVFHSSPSDLCLLGDSMPDGLQGSRDWEVSMFGALEEFLVQFFMGCGGNSPVDGEGIRLKLQTPVYVADALLEAAGKVGAHWAQQRVHAASSCSSSRNATMHAGGALGQAQERWSHLLSLASLTAVQYS